MKCAECANWTVRRRTVYGDGSEIVTFEAPDGKGHCDALGVDTAPEFGCAAFAAGAVPVKSAPKAGAPWQHFTMIACPDCAGNGDGARGHRCAGTGLVRLYDDGHVGDEQTRMHPKEKELAEPPKCSHCSEAIKIDWMACPKCGNKLPAMSPTEEVANPLGGGSM